MKLDEYISYIKPGSTFSLDKLYVVGPYPSERFVAKICEILAPRSIVLVVDDGWPQEYIDDITDCAKAFKVKLKTKRVCPVSGGLVHAKLYYFVWRNEAGNRTKRKLLLGSANASLSGFGGHAETYINVDVGDLGKVGVEKVDTYFASLGRGDDVEMIMLDINEGAWLSLPAIKKAPKEKLSGFEAWIRRGRLCHAYQQDMSFGRLALNLKLSLPRTNLENSILNSGFGRETESKSYGRNYVELDTPVEGGQIKLIWRKKYFIETDYGYWTSEDCFAYRSEEFVAPKAEKRREILNIIKGATALQKESWVDEFMAAVTDLVNQIKSEVEISDYFNMVGDDLDWDHYRKSALKKIDADQQKSRDSYFVDRFISGFSFPLVPQLGDEFENFAMSLCVSLSKQINGTATGKLAQALRPLGKV